MKKSIFCLATLMGIVMPLIASCGEKPVEPTEKPTEKPTEVAPTEKPTEAPVEKEFKVVDVKGRELTFKKHAEKAICLGAGSLRLYSYVGDMSKLIGVEDYERVKEGATPTRPYQFVYKEVLDKLPSCGKGGPGKPSYDYELLATLQPDVIFTCDKADSAFLDGITQKTNVPVCAIDYGKLNIFDTNVEGNPFKVSLKTISQIMGTEAKYEALSSYIDEVVADLDTSTKDIAEDKKNSVYFGGVGKKLAKGLECSQQNHPVLNSIHAKNILDGQTFEISGQLQVDKEYLATINPERVLIDFGGLADVKKQLSTAGEKETFAKWDALTNGHAYVMLPYGDYNTQAECALLNAMFARSICFQQETSDFDTLAKGNEVFEKFYGTKNFAEFLEANGLTDILFKSVKF